MAFFLFVDESGHDHKSSPYEVLSGVSVEDRDLWNLVRALQDCEERHFGRRYSGHDRELKAKLLLKRKTFRLAAQMPLMPIEQRRALALAALTDGEKATREQLTALAQSKLEFVAEALELCARYRCQAFASIVNVDSAVPDGNSLRKDYAYLFERFYYYLEDRGGEDSGIVVFDELERSQSHILIGQMDTYFKTTRKGKQRAGLIIPEPLFVHSDLTTGVQLADLIAYIVSWSVRLPNQGMDKPAREELAPFREQVCRLRYRAKRDIDGNPNFVIWSFQYIEDLRPLSAQEVE